MGKFAFSVVGMLLFLGTGGALEAKPTLQSKLPSEVKKVKPQKGKSPLQASSSKQKKIISPQILAPKLAKKISGLEDSGLSPFEDKYVSRTVHFAASVAPVPEEYDCDSLIEEKQKRQAERDAIAKCEMSGKEHCRLHLIEIVKKGELICQDIPGRDCQQKKFYRGCVAQAIVVSEEVQEEQASVF